jgi:polysaccharide deacetylase family protein (PEP-CTERM system associated)
VTSTAIASIAVPRAAMLRHMISIDVEEYFQVESVAHTVPRESWGDYAPRAGEAVDRVLDVLGERGVSATFFVLGWVAEHEPDVVRRIACAGHEIASHGAGHEMIGRLTPEAFRSDLVDSRKRLEDLCGAPVIGYRAPTFSVTRKTAWALDVLVEAGFRYDSSVFPVHHDRYGVPDAPRFAHRAVGPGGGEILEIPPLTWRLCGSNFPVGGGGYLRLLPVRVVGRALRAAGRAGRSGMIYLHPWELDPGQPVLPMSRLSRWRHRVGLARTEKKLRWLLERFEFTSVKALLSELTASATERFRYG